MDKEEIKTKCDLNRIEEKIFTNVLGTRKIDYIIDNDGNAILPVPVLEFKMIEKILDLEARIIELEKK